MVVCYICLVTHNKKIFSQEQINYIINQYLSGDSTTKIAKYFSVNFKIILRILKENNIKIRKQKTLLSNKQKKDIIKLYSNGLSAKSIALQFNIKPIFIQRLIKKSVKETRQSHQYLKKFSDDVIDNIISDYFNKFSYCELSNKYSCSVILIKKEIKKYLYKTNLIFCRECQEIKDKINFFDKKQFCICNQCRLNISLEKKKQRNIKRHQDRLLNPQARIHHSIGSSIRNHLKNNGKKFSALPYSATELIEHLQSQFEPWMNWNNYGKYDPKTWRDDDNSTWTWQIDHIIPASTFNYSSTQDEDFFKCWSLNNLRPLNSKQNYLDGVRKTRHKIA